MAVTLPLTGAGDVTAIAATDNAGASGQVQIVKLALSASGSAVPLTVDADGMLVNLGLNNDVTVTGSVTANAGANLNTSALALDATLTGGTAKAIARGGAKGTTVAGDITSNPVDANTQALHVNLAGVNAVNATLTAETVKVIGTVNIAAAQTIAAVTAITNALPVGANVIGKVSIDQATPGTTNAVQVIALGAASTANSTAVNLSAGAVFTGTSEDVLEFAMMAVSIFSSHVSATDGLSIQQSSNGTNWDFMDVFTIPAVTGKTFSIPVQARFVRLVYTNGATLTTSLRIQTLFYKAAKGENPLRPQDASSNEIDIGETLSYSMGYNGTTWDRLRASIVNGLAVDVKKMPASDLAITATAAANTALTLTIPAAGAGLFHYITSLHIGRTATAALAGTATLVITSTNLPGAWAESVGNAMAAGATQRDLQRAFTAPFKSSVANTATTIVMPAPGAAVLWRAWVTYYTGV